MQIRMFVVVIINNKLVTSSSWLYRTQILYDFILIYNLVIYNLLYKLKIRGHLVPIMFIMKLKIIC